MFWIGFTDEPLIKVDHQEEGRVGLLVLGDREERFVVHMETWPKGDYVFQWKLALKRVLSGKPSALITDMYTPATSNHLVWWPMWKVGSQVLFHNQLLFFEKYPMPYFRRHRGKVTPITIDWLYKLVGERESQSRDGTPLSEWTVPVHEIEEFLKTAG